MATDNRPMHTEIEKPASFTIETQPLICDQLALLEPVFQTIIDSFGYPPFWARPANFETLVHIILEQQVSLASALAALKKLQERLGTVTPEGLLRLSDEEMRACYFSRQKAGYARHLAEMVVKKQLDIAGLAEMDNESVSHHLRQVKGIGHWTVDVFLMMVLHRQDCFPLGDIALINSMKYEMGLPASTAKELLLERAASWQPHRTVAAFMLWHSYLCRRKPKPPRAQ